MAHSPTHKQILVLVKKSSPEAASPTQFEKLTARAKTSPLGDTRNWRRQKKAGRLSFLAA